jgi:tetratricopeptide (TPR) repeat protein
MMTNRPAVRALLASFVLAATSLGQSTPPQKQTDPPCPPANQTGAKPTTDKPDKPCTPPTETKKPSTAEQFPFPGEPAKPIAPADAAAPDAPKPNPSHPSAADEHPFPTQSPPMSDADSSSSSSSSSSSGDSSSSADPDAPKPVPWVDDAASTRSTRKRLPKVQKLQSDEDRAAEDLDVAKFYEGKGNLDAAYLRTKDAVKVQPNDPETHFALAQIAEKLKKRDEAIAEYNAYLKLDPDGEKIKTARKALSQLQ